MTDNYRPIFERLDAAAVALIRANEAVMAAHLAAHQALQQVGASLTEIAHTTQHARDEHEDIRETVHRLETLVTELLRRQNGHDPS